MPLLRVIIPLLALSVILTIDSADAQPSWQQRRVIVQLNDNSSISGFVEGIDSAMLVVKTTQGIDSIKSTSIRKVSVIKDLDITPLAIYGFVGGYWLTSYEASSNNFGNASTPQWLGFFGGCLPGLIGLLLDNIDRDDRETFEFKGKNSDEAEYSKLREYLARTPSKARFRILFNNGPQIPMVGSRLAHRFEKSGLGETPPANAPVRINMLRSIQATYAMKPNIDLGLMIALFGEQLPYYSDSYIDYSSPHGGSHSSFGEESVTSSGYFLIGAYRFPVDEWETIDVSVGGGFGLTSINYKFKGNIFIYNDSTNIDDTWHTSESKILPGGLVFARMNFYLTEALTLGVNTDCIVTGNLQIPAQEKLNLPTEAVSFGNASITLSIGWRF